MDATLAATITRIFIDHADASDSLWAALVEHGLTQVALIQHGGTSTDNESTVELSAQDYFGLLQLAGQTITGLQLCEHLLARWLLDSASIQVPDGKLSVVSDEQIVRSNGTKTAQRCVFGVDSDFVVWLSSDVSQHQVLMASVESSELCSSIGLDPIANVNLTPIECEQTVPLWLDARAVHAMGALMRACQISGALSAVHDLTIQYAEQRIQFGRKLAKFQAIQHLLSAIAGESAAATAAVNKAIDEFDVAALSKSYTMAIAKIRTSEAVNTVTAHAHQVHGALGYTEEYALANYSRRLWQWRDDFGCEYFWSEYLGKRIMEAGRRGESPVGEIKQYSTIIDALLGEIDE